MNPLVTVVIPTFNRRHLVQEALTSVFAQTYRPIEIIVVDDCSTDGTVDALSKLDFPEPVIVVACPTNAGPATARNTGIDRATGEYIAFLDSDDKWLTDKLESQINLIRSDPMSSAALVYSQVLIKRKHETIVRPLLEIGADCVADYIFCNEGRLDSSNIMLATAIAQEVRYDQTLRLHEDWDFYLRLQKRGVKFIMIPRPLSVTNDTSLIGRASAPRPTATLDWLDERKHVISSSAFLALRAKIAPQLRRYEPVLALSYIIDAYRQQAINTWYLVTLLGALVHPQIREIAYRVRGGFRRPARGV